MPLFLSRADVCTTPQARWKSSIVCSCSNLCAYVRERSKVRQQEDTLDVSQPTWRLRKFSSSTRTFCHSGQNACACAAPLLSANVPARRDMTTTVPTQGFNEMVRLASCFQPKGLSVSHRYDSAMKKYFWYDGTGSLASCSSDGTKKASSGKSCRRFRRPSPDVVAKRRSILTGRRSAWHQKTDPPKDAG